MGASAVLLFAAPHVPFSQPWNVFGGHIISAIVGVACWQWIPDYTVAASASVGLAIGAMYFARCIHPPGGQLHWQRSLARRNYIIWVLLMG